jgi:hypothetical protein
MSQFMELALERGVEILPHRLRGSGDREAYQRAHELLDSADGMILCFDSLLRDPSLTDHIASRVAAGINLLVKVDVNDIVRLNPFLSRYGIECTSIGLYSSNAAQYGSRWLEINREEFPESFRDFRLFTDVFPKAGLFRSSLRKIGSTFKRCSHMSPFCFRRREAAAEGVLAYHPRDHELVR